MNRVATDCLCEWVDIIQNFALSGTGHEPGTVTPVAPGPTSIWYWYATYALVSVYGTPGASP